VSLTIPAEAHYIEVTLYYQGTSREYVEFLRDEINGTASTLSSPTPSGETNAYIIQTDPFFSKLKAWGNTIWDLWYHNHGLDDIGTPVDGIVPFEMTKAEVDLTDCLVKKAYSKDWEKVVLLRSFRDNLLRKTPEGCEIIRLYYQWSPVIVKAMEEDEKFKEEVKEMIDRVLPLIENTVE